MTCRQASGDSTSADRPEGGEPLSDWAVPLGQSPDRVIVALSSAPRPTIGSLTPAARLKRRIDVIQQ